MRPFSTQLALHYLCISPRSPTQVKHVPLSDDHVQLRTFFCHHYTILYYHLCRLVGDVEFDEAVKRAGAITPVPGEQNFGCL